MELVAARGTAVAEGAFEAFFASVWPDLVAFCTALTGSSALGEELTQEALVRVYARFPLLREPRPYAFRVATNLARKSWRTRTFVEVPDQAVPAPDGGTLDAVRRLPPRLREVVLLHYWADLPVADVAAQLHRPVGTVKRRLSEARALLGRTLMED